MSALFHVSLHILYMYIHYTRTYTNIIHIIWRDIKDSHKSSAVKTVLYNFTEKRVDEE